MAATASVSGLVQFPDALERQVGGFVHIDLK
jgi:hypothetical protein